MRFPATVEPVWRDRAFLLLWSGQSVSLVGSQVTALALPLVAALTLGASAWEMGVLAACARAPYLVLGLPAGAWVDRLPRRPLLVACALGQAAVLGVVPLADALDVLSVPLLCSVAVGAGAFAVVGDIAMLALVPLVVPADRLTRAQGAFETSQSTAQVAGPALAGWLVAAFGAPVALLADALSFVVSAATVAGIRVREVVERGGGVFAGVRLVFGQRLLRRVTLCTATLMFWVSAFLALLPLHLARDGLSPGRIGLVLAVGAAGGLVGALVAPRLGENAMPVVVAVAGVGAAGVALHPLTIALMWFGVQIYHVLQVPVRYRLTPAPLHGRVNAAIRTAVWGATPVGALVGGVVAETAGVGTALVVSGAGAGVACLWLVRR